MALHIKTPGKIAIGLIIVVGLFLLLKPMILKDQKVGTIVKDSVNTDSAYVINADTVKTVTPAYVPKTTSSTPKIAPKSTPKSAPKKETKPVKKTEPKKDTKKKGERENLNIEF